MCATIVQDGSDRGGLGAQGTPRGGGGPGAHGAAGVGVFMVPFLVFRTREGYFYYYDAKLCQINQKVTYCHWCGEANQETIDCGYYMHTIVQLLFHSTITYMIQNINWISKILKLCNLLKFFLSNKTKFGSHHCLELPYQLNFTSSHLGLRI